MTQSLRLLDDDAIRRFLRQGYLTFHVEMPAGFNAHLCQRLDTTIEQEGNWGNNILPRIPEIQDVFDHPALRGALTSVLGPNYLMHPHRYAHRNLPGTKAQQLHKDSTAYSGDQDIRHHRSRWAMAFYYPQDVTDDMGPTSVLRGTQYYEQLSDAPENPETRFLGPAGTVTIVHFDLWHRATANTSQKPRYMLKFLFARMEEPQCPTWNTQTAAWESGTEYAETKHDIVYRHLWRWLRGEGRARVESAPAGLREGISKLKAMLGAPDARARAQAAQDLGHLGGAADAAIPALIEALGDEVEAVGLNAAYALATIGNAAIPALIGGLRSGHEETRRHASTALGIIGEAAIPELTQATRDDDWQARSYAVDALGDIALPLRGVIPTLTKALSDPSDWVRRHAADALGALGAAAGDAAGPLAALLQDEKPYVRINAATALGKLGRAAEETIPMLKSALNDPDRYTRSFAAIALRRIGTPAATETLLDHLMVTRWCPITTIKTPY